MWKKPTRFENTVIKKYNLKSCCKNSHAAEKNTKVVNDMR